MIKRAAEHGELRRVQAPADRDRRDRLGCCWCIRAFEFNSLNVYWYDNAYGSVVWMLLVLHTTHIVHRLGAIRWSSPG